MIVVLANFKYRCFERRVAKFAAKNQRTRLVHSFSSAKNVGIVAQISDVRILDKVLDFKRRIEENGTMVNLLVYYPEKVVPTDFLLRNNVDIIDSNMISWLKIPVSSIVDSFLAKKFDMLVDLSLREILPIRWVSALSMATFKVGLLKYDKNPFDLIVSTKHSDGYTKIFADIEAVLQLIKR